MLLLHSSLLLSNRVYSLGNLVENEILGKEIEMHYASKLKGKLSEDFSCYDIEANHAFYEVKCTHKIIKNGSGTNREGRFSIHADSHKNMQEYYSPAFYIFVLLDENHNIISEKTLPFLVVDELLKNHKPISRGDYQIKHSLIFGGS